jgi:hypothetical protein
LTYRSTHQHATIIPRIPSGQLIQSPVAKVTASSAPSISQIIGAKSARPDLGKRFTSISLFKYKRADHQSVSRHDERHNDSRQFVISNCILLADLATEPFESLDEFLGLWQVVILGLAEFLGVVDQDGKIAAIKTMPGLQPRQASPSQQDESDQQHPKKQIPPRSSGDAHCQFGAD